MNSKKLVGLRVFGPVVSLGEFYFNQMLLGSTLNFSPSKCDHETLFPKWDPDPHSNAHFLVEMNTDKSIYEDFVREYTDLPLNSPTNTWMKRRKC